MTSAPPITFAAFLLERIAEDEEAARGVIADMPRWDAPSWEADVLEVGASLPCPQFTARMSPARVLADCEAKRRIVAEHARDGVECRVCADEETWDENIEGRWYYRPSKSWPCPTLRLLALPYADHSAYRPEWRP